MLSNSSGVFLCSIWLALDFLTIAVILSQKVDGCNKMVCYKCHSFFCWLCLTILPKHNPYDHFKDESVRCYGRLNVGAINDEEDNNDENYVGP